MCPGFSKHLGTLAGRNRERICYLLKRGIRMPASLATLNFGAPWKDLLQSARADGVDLKISRSVSAIVGRGLDVHF